MRKFAAISLAGIMALSVRTASKYLRCRNSNRHRLQAKRLAEGGVLYVSFYQKRSKFL